METAERNFHEPNPPNDKLQAISMNSHVVRLIKDKLLPLHRGRYDHLQKINKALRKDKLLLTNPSTAALTTHPTHRPHNLNTHSKALTPRTHIPTITTELLLDRLKEVNPKNSHSQPSSLRKSWQSVLLRISNILTIPSEPDIHECHDTKSRSTRRREPFFDLALRAERHLRMRKHELRERYLEEQQGGRKTVGRPSDLEELMGHLGEKRIKGASEEQLEKELLNDIREGMLEEKINRLKKDINHKKIVQMR